jgi:hypothetical protein
VEEDGMYIDDFEVMVSGIGIEEDMINSGKDNIVCHPNPANNLTSVDFYLTKAGQTKIQLYDSKGQLVKTLADNWMDAGIHQKELEVTGLKSGIYYISMECNGLKMNRKLVITK